MSGRKKTPRDHPELGLPEVKTPWQTEGLFSEHYLKTRIQRNPWWPADPEAAPLWEFCRELYNRRYVPCAKNNEAFTRQELLDKILEKLGFAWTDNLGLPDQDAEPDYVLFASAAEKEAVLAASKDKRYRAAVAILEAKKVNHPLSQISKHQQRYPHQQIRDYLQEAQVLGWGILTNGNQWRLYCRDAKPREFFALNFPVAIQSLQNFKYFLALFSPAAFVRDSQGKCRLDHVRESALTAQTELEADLRQRIFTIVETLAQGLAERPENQITDADLPRLYHDCLIYLYRLLFILYAEGRQLLPVEAQSRKYYKQLSLARLLPSLKNFSEYDSRTQTRLYREINDLCHVINGTDEAANKEFGVPRYNGGLFDPAAHPDLERWVVGDAVLATVLRGLIFNPLPDPRQPGLPVETVDYADLSVQQPGSIYEGLLEHHFVRDNGRLALKTDKAERKATGTYYTPDYIVKYIVEHTLRPLLDDIEQRPAVKAGKPDTFADAVLALNICDPAMGSGHFLVEATTYLADHIVYHPTTRFQADFQRGESQEETEIAYWRRRVVEACIYGVDLNPLAVELAKLSLWLTTIATDQPLNFLDHHLRCGNSLIGARLDQLSRLPSRKGRPRSQGPSTQTEFAFGPDLKRAVADAIREIHRIEAQASGDVSAVKDKERRWQEKVLPALAPYKAVADLWTATWFGHPLDEEAYVVTAREWIGRNAGPRAAAATPQPHATEPHATERIPVPEPWRSTAASRHFFHWELEFPEVFFDDTGQPKPSPGFDAVIGNPPWLGLRTGEIERGLLDYVRVHYNSAAGQFDLAAIFLELGCRLAATDSPVGEVVPKRILTNESYEKLRETLVVDRNLASAVDLGVAFDGVDNDAAILVSGAARTGTGVTTLGQRIGETKLQLWPLPSSVFPVMPFHIVPVNSDAAAVNLVASLVAGDIVSLGEIAEITRGAECGMNHPAISRQRTARALPLIDHLDMDRYFVLHEGWYVDLSRMEAAVLKPVAVYQTAPKLLIRFLSAKLVVAVDVTGFASTNLIYHASCGAETYFLCSLLCSRLLNFWYRTAFQNEEVKFPHVQKSHLVRLPIRRIAFTTPPAERKRRATRGRELYEAALKNGEAGGLLEFVEQELKGRRSDVVHDLLAFLAQRMMAMNKEKHAAARGFLTDLKDFHGVDAHGLKPKTKLDQFWTLEVGDVFAHLKANTRLLAAQGVHLKESDDQKIRSRFQKATAKILPLERALAFTDSLIDQIVYRLYDLTPEEIQIVEDAGR